MGVKLKPEIPQLDHAEIFDAMGYGNARNNGLLPIIESVLDELEMHLDIQAGYKRLFCKASIKDDALHFDKVAFQTGNIIATQLKGLEDLAIFTATLGSGFDKWSQECFKSMDPLKGFIVDTVGSVLVEKVADQLEEKLRREMKLENMGCSNRFSPGYCGWNVSEQHKLFSLLPSGFCDITLTKTALMVPVKSVSGIIGIGKNLYKKDYHCSLCDQKNCYMRRKK